MPFKKAVTRQLKEKEFFGHPAGLFVLFFTEMWERFSYYGMRALLILYMTQYLLLKPERAHAVLGYNSLEHFLIQVFGPMNIQAMSSQIYGLYTAFVYFTPIFGGLLADKVLGQYRTVYLGGILMAIGHFLMASERMFLLALLFLIVGNGAFKPNIATQVGHLYKPGDHRRDGAFTIFYMGVNLGAIFSPLVCGTLGQKVGWHWGFGAAGVGMLLGLFVYWLGDGLFPHSNQPEVKQGSKEAKLSKKDWIGIASLCFIGVLAILFWAVYEQQGNTLQLWAEERTNWWFFGFDIPSSWFQSFNPIMIVFLAPLLDKFWSWQAKLKKVPGSITKMGIGCLFCGGAYILMILAAKAVPDGQKGSVLWLTGTVLAFTIGELYLSPIGLSLVTKVAPKSIMSMMMGVWYLSIFFGNYLAGYLGMYYSRMSKEGFFTLLTGLGVTSGIAFFLVHKPLSKAIGGKNI